MYAKCVISLINVLLRALPTLNSPPITIAYYPAVHLSEQFRVVSTNKKKEPYFNPLSLSLSLSLSIFLSGCVQPIWVVRTHFVWWKLSIFSKDEEWKWSQGEAFAQAPSRNRKYSVFIFISLYPFNSLSSSPDDSSILNPQPQFLLGVIFMFEMRSGLSLSLSVSLDNDV